MYDASSYRKLRAMVGALNYQADTLPYDHFSDVRAYLVVGIMVNTALFIMKNVNKPILRAHALLLWTNFNRQSRTT